MGHGGRNALLDNWERWQLVTPEDSPVVPRPDGSPCCACSWLVEPSGTSRGVHWTEAPEPLRAAGHPAPT